MPSLCTYCASINWDGMRPPDSEQMVEILADQPDNRKSLLSKSSEPIEKIYFGSLLRMQQDALYCALCRLFVEIIRRQGAVYHDEEGQKSLRDDNIFFRADNDVSYYGRIKAANSSGRCEFVSRRLTLSAYRMEDGPPQNPGSGVAHFDNLVQLCEIGALSKPSSQVRSLKYESVSGLLFGGRKRPLLFDPELIRSWLSICSTDHGQLCMMNLTFSPSTRINCFRALDWKSQCLVQFFDVDISKIAFVALSYVWGKNQTFKLLKENVHELTTPGSLEQRGLPRTIADALELTKRLDMPYLWVDVLCIIQNDLDDKAYQINKMASIYLNSALTIATAAGTDCEAGLPGLHPGTRSYEQQEVVVVESSAGKPGLSVLNSLRSHSPGVDAKFTRGADDLERSIWRTRGWTMQENLLPCRIVTFTDEQVFWTCQQAYYCEETCWEVDDVRFEHFYPSTHKRPLLRKQHADDDPWRTYASLIEEFTSRSLTHKGDIHDSFSAVVDVMKVKSRTTFLWGIPRSHFELALSWDSLSGVIRRKELTTLPMTDIKERVELPSWSWMGWEGDVQCTVHAERRENETATIVCFIHHKRPNLHLTYVADDPELTQSEESSIWAPKDINDRRVAIEDVTTHVPSAIEVLYRTPDEHVLLFWAVSSFFKVRYPRMGKTLRTLAAYASQARPIVLDKAGATVGEMTKLLDNDATEFPDGTYEFVLVARRDLGEELWDIYPPVMIALMVLRDQHSIVRRVHRAEIQAKAWTESLPEKRLFVMA